MAVLDPFESNNSNLKTNVAEAYSSLDTLLRRVGARKVDAAAAGVIVAATPSDVSAL
jgi:hypothetical protein